jgi:hypothetical protein
MHVAGAIFVSNTQKLGFELPNLNEIYERNKLLVDNQDIIKLIGYIQYLLTTIKGHIASNLLKELEDYKNIEKQIPKNDVKESNIIVGDEFINNG